MWKRSLKHRVVTGIVTGVVPVLMACSAGLTDVPDPSTIIDPDVVKTQDGAIGLYRSARSMFSQAFGADDPTGTNGSFALAVGLASDEFVTGVAGYTTWLNLRRVETNGPGNLLAPYGTMHQVRLEIEEAMGALQTYGKTTPSSYVAELYALRGYLYVMFAELYCSGVPFSRAVYGGDIVLGEPQTTTQMFEAAVAQFDSSLAVTTDSVRVKRLAYVGKARALLNLNRAAEAAAVVSEANVPTSFAYNNTYSTFRFPNYFNPGSASFVSIPFKMADRSGSNGLDYTAAGNPAGSGGGDPRVRWYLSSSFPQSEYPERYGNGGTAIPLANGTEARLIEAEAKLRANDIDGWTAILNTLREGAEGGPIPDLPADSTTTASDTLRQNVMFRERAFWLYGTGHRLGDMRRLVRQYDRQLRKVFPIGAQPMLQSPNNIFADVPSLEPPKAELQNNPKYRGCLNHDA